MVEMTKSTKAWLEGIKAFEEGKASSANPYPPEDLMRSSWSSGYFDAEVIGGKKESA